MGSGYGSLGLGYKKGHALAHRFSYEMHRGPIPAGLCVLHKCDVKTCVNPDHLFLGTLIDNNADMKRKGRNRGGGAPAKITKAQVEEIRALLSAGVSHKKIAQRFGISPRPVENIYHGRGYKCL